MNKPVKNILEPVDKTVDSAEESDYVFADILQKFESPLLRYVGQLLGNGAPEVEDIVQETFLRLHKQVEKHGADSIRKMSTWLFHVAHNLGLDAIRKRRRDTEKNSRALEDKKTSVSAQVDVLGEVMQREASDRALAELHNLPEEQRQVILLRVMHGMKLREISEVTGLTIGNASYRITQGLTELARRLQAGGVV